MQWFIIGRDMNVLANPSTDAEGSLPIDDSSGGQEISISNNVATGTYDFDTIANHKDSEHIKVGNYVAFIDKYGKHRLYTIMTVEGDSELSVHCEDIGLDLINEDADEWDTTGNPEPVATTLERVLGDTGWTIGINEIADRKRATKYTSLTDSQLSRIGMIMNTFEAECDFEIVMEGSKVVKQVVNIYQSLGQDLTNQRFVDEQNLVSLSRNESIEDLCTCMRCFGKENEETHQRLTIADVVYDDGRYYSPKGHTKIYDREAHDKWSRFRAYKYEGQTEFLGYINGTFEYDTENAQELFNRGLSELKTKNEKKVAYEAELYELQADIGDTIQIADHSFIEPTYISARIQSVKNHYTVKGEDTGVLANYKLLVSNPTKDISKLLEELKNQVVSVESSTVSYQKGDFGTEIPGGEWSTHPVPVEAGKYLWTRTIITYTDGSSTTSYSVSKNGLDGTPGTPGKDATVQSPTPPEDKEQLWLDTSVSPPLLKRWNGQYWEVVNDFTGDIQELQKEVTETISRETGKIKMEVSDRYYTKEDGEDLKAEISTSLEQTNNQFEFLFNKVNEDLINSQNSANENFQKIQKYIRFIDGDIVLGEVENELTLRIQNNRISFLQNNSEVAYFSNRKMHVTDGNYANSLTIGNFAFIPSENDSLSFKKIR